MHRAEEIPRFIEPETDILRGFLQISSVCPGKNRDSTLNMGTTTSIHNLTFLIVLSFDAIFVFWDSDSKVK
jgi:hypothetical protein